MRWFGLLLVAFLFSGISGAAPVTEDATIEPNWLQLDVAYGSVLAAEGDQVAAAAPRYYGGDAPPSIVQGWGRVAVYEWNGSEFSEISYLDGEHTCQRFGYELDLAVYPDGKTLLGAQRKALCSALFSVDPFVSAHERDLEGSWTDLDNDWYALDSVSVTTAGGTATLLAGNVDASVATDSVVEIEMANWEGSGYSWGSDVGREVTIAPPSTPGGETATAVIASVSMGGVRRIDVTFGGSGYTSNPTVTLPAPLGGGIPGNASSSRNAAVGSVTFIDVTGGSADQTVKPDGGSDGDRFGSRVAIDGDRAAVVANGANKVYLVTRGGSGWEITQTIEPAAAGTAGFGSAVALVGDDLVVGASTTDADGQTDVGRAFYFDLGADPISEVVLAPAVPVSREYFGGSVAANGDGVVLVGAPGPSSQEIMVGRAFAFEIDGAGVVTELAEMTPSDGAVGDHFGTSVAIVDDQALVGAPDHNEDRGAVYVYELAISSCPALEGSPAGDLDGDGVCDGSDACPNDAENDVDGDGVCGDVDNCPVNFNASQGDSDDDGAGNVCDSCPVDDTGDSDGDGSCDSNDLCTGDDNSGDPDGDEICNDVDMDDDGDGLLDDYETGTGVYSGLQDTGTDPLLADTDGDGIDDALEVGAGSDPNDAGSVPGDGEPVPSLAPGTAGLLLCLMAFLGARGLRRGRRR